MIEYVIYGNVCATDKGAMSGKIRTGDVPTYPVVVESFANLVYIVDPIVNSPMTIYTFHS